MEKNSHKQNKEKEQTTQRYLRKYLYYSGSKSDKEKNPLSLTLLQEATPDGGSRALRQLCERKEKSSPAECVGAFDSAGARALFG